MERIRPSMISENENRIAIRQGNELQPLETRTIEVHEPDPWIIKRYPEGDESSFIRGLRLHPTCCRPSLLRQRRRVTLIANQRTVAYRQHAGVNSRLSKNASVHVSTTPYVAPLNQYTMYDQRGKDHRLGKYR